MFFKKATLNIINNFESNSDIYILASKKLEAVVVTKLNLKQTLKIVQKIVFRCRKLDYDKLFEIGEKIND